MAGRHLSKAQLTHQKLFITLRKEVQGEVETSRRRRRKRRRDGGLRRGDASSGRVRLADQFRVSADAAGGHRLQGGNVIKTFLTIFVINAQGPVL